MGLPLHRTQAALTIRLDGSMGALIELEGEMSVGTETRWVGPDGKPCRILDDDARKQERFSITTDWEDVDE